MANKNLTRKWISYLKGMQIIRQTSDTSGKLLYKKPVTSANLVHFLMNATDLDEDTIYDAIETALKKNGQTPERLLGKDAADQVANPENQVQNQQQNQQQNQVQNPENRVQNQPQLPNRSPQKKKWNTDDAEDVEYKDVPNNPDDNSPPQLHYSGRQNSRGGKKAGIVSQTPDAIRKRAARLRKKSLKEDFVDENVELSEKVVEDVFDILDANNASNASNASNANNAQQSQQGTPDDINKVKNIIKTKMNKSLRKMLWQLLQESAVNESRIDRNETKAILQSIIDNKSYGKLKNKNITLQDLQKAWKDTGFSNNTQNIGDLLKKYGFGDTEIHRVFNNILGGNSDYDEDEDENAPPLKPNPQVIEFAKYIKTHGYTDAVIEYLKTEFSDEVNPPQSSAPHEEPETQGFLGKAMNWAKNKFGKKTATVEEVRHIFTAMLLEDRTMQQEYINEIEKQLLGRSRK